LALRRAEPDRTGRATRSGSIGNSIWHGHLPRAVRPRAPQPLAARTVQTVVYAEKRNPIRTAEAESSFAGGILIRQSKNEYPA